MSLTIGALSVNNVKLHVEAAGEGPLVLLIHGWPEIGYSWRRQIPALLDAGFRVVVPDMRGYGKSEAPADVRHYTILDIVGDLVALVAAFGEKQAYLVGHDFGAVAAWNAAMMRPDIFKAVVALSVPVGKRPPQPPLQLVSGIPQATHYWNYFQEEGVAEKEFELDPDAVFRKLFGNNQILPAGLPFIIPKGRGFLDGLPHPSELPSWISEEEIKVFADTFRLTGFRGGFNWYRNIDRNWRLTAPWESAMVLQPALFIAGSNDPVISSARGKATLPGMSDIAPKVEQLVIADAGHWIQQEKTAEVNAALVDFLTRNV